MWGQRTACHTYGSATGWPALTAGGRSLVMSRSASWSCGHGPTRTATCEASARAMTATTTSGSSHPSSGCRRAPSRPGGRRGRQPVGLTTSDRVEADHDAGWWPIRSEAPEYELLPVGGFQETFEINRFWTLQRGIQGDVVPGDNARPPFALKTSGDNAVSGRQVAVLRLSATRAEPADGAGTVHRGTREQRGGSSGQA